jgi:hypothetical protein
LVVSFLSSYASLRLSVLLFSCCSIIKYIVFRVEIGFGGGGDPHGDAVPVTSAGL